MVIESRATPLGPLAVIVTTFVPGKIGMEAVHL